MKGVDQPENGAHHQAVDAAYRREKGCDERSQTAVLAIAGSAGGLTAMRQILACLPADFPAPILYLQHLNGSYRSNLPEVLQWHSVLKVCWAQQGERLAAGVVSVCPAACSPFVHPDGTVTLTRTATSLDVLHGADRLFGSVAANYAHRAIVIVLSGGGWDGIDGVCAVRARNGTVLVQDEASAWQPSMPRAAIATGCADLVLRLKDIAPALVSLLRDGYPLAILRDKAARLAERKCLSPSPALQDMLDRFLELAVRMYGTDLGNIQLYEPQTGNLAIVAQRGFGLDFLEHFGAVNRQDGSACGRAMRRQGPVFIQDVDADPGFAAHREMAAAAGFRAVQSTPLINRDGTFLGVVSTHFRRPRNLSDTELYRLDRHRGASDLIEQLAH
jgi:hypothetical protein